MNSFFFPTSPTLPSTNTLQISSFCKGMTSGLWGKGICQMVLVTVLCCIRQLEELQGLAGILATLTLSVALTHLLHPSGFSDKFFTS